MTILFMSLNYVYNGNEENKTHSIKLNFKWLRF